MARKKNDINWLVKKRELMALQQQEKILAFKVKISETSSRVNKIRGRNIWLKYPPLEIRSMYAPEGPLLLKEWLKRPYLKMRP